MSADLRFIELSWLILEAKILYYDPRGLPQAFVEKKMPSDATFDGWTDEYLSLCRSLGKENTLVHDAPADIPGTGMMEVDWNRRSTNCALEKLNREVTKA